MVKTYSITISNTNTGDWIKRTVCANSKVEARKQVRAIFGRRVDLNILILESTPHDQLSESDAKEI